MHACQLLGLCVLLVQLVEHAMCCPNCCRGSQAADQHLARLGTGQTGFGFCFKDSHVKAYSSSVQPALALCNVLDFVVHNQHSKEMLARKRGFLSSPSGA